MSEHMNRRFDKMRKEAGTKFTSAGLIIRLILLLVLLFGCKFVCDTFTEKSYEMHNYDTYERSD